MPVEDIDASGAGAMVTAGDRFGAQAIFVILLFRTDEGIGEITVEAGINSDLGTLAQLSEPGNIDAGVGDGVASGNDEVDESLLDPGRDVIADLPAHLE